MNTGKVWLVGAGPGDAGLITVKGLACLREAEVLVFDRLVNPSLLNEAPAHCQRIDVGKQANHHPVPQQDINQKIINFARLGYNVVRLKGGDPFVFGRGGEECQALHAAGIAFEVVPGVTAAIGGLASAGIPVTHRDYASGFHVVTGHLQDGKQPQDWAALARVPGTLVVLMGMTQLGSICDALISGGKPATTPAAVISQATTPQQRAVYGTLSDLPVLCHAAGLCAPGLIVIGDVVQLHHLFTLNAVPAG